MSDRFVSASDLADQVLDALHRPAPVNQHVTDGPRCGDRHPHDLRLVCTLPAGHEGLHESRDCAGKPGPHWWSTEMHFRGDSCGDFPHPFGSN